MHLNLLSTFICATSLVLGAALDTSVSSGNTSLTVDGLPSNPVPKGFRSRIVVFDRTIHIDSNDVYTLLVKAAAAIAKLPYDEVMTLTHLAWPIGDPSLEIVFKSLSERPLKVRHQLWGLYACANSLATYNFRIRPTFCYFGLESPYNMGKITFWARKPNTNPDLNSTGSVFARAVEVNSSDPSLIPTGTSGNDTSGSLIDDHGHRTFQIGFFTRTMLGPSQVATNFIEFIIACAAATYSRTRYLYEGEYATQTLTTTWALAPRAPQTTFLEWQDLISAAAATMEYMWTNNMFYECAYVILFDGNPTVKGRFRRRQSLDPPV